MREKKNIMIERNKKYNRPAALILAAAVLFMCAAPISGSADYEAGGIASFELRDAATGENVLGTILDKSAARDIASYENPFICTRLNIVNARVYAGDGSAVECGGFYWRASSLDSGVAEATGEHTVSGDKNSPVGGGVYDDGYVLRVDALAAGITVVSVEVSANPDMSGSIIKTFTIRVINDEETEEEIIEEIIEEEIIEEIIEEEIIEEITEEEIVEEIEEIEEIEKIIEEETEEETEEAEIIFTDESDDGKIVSFGFMAGEKWVVPGNYLEAKMDMDGKAESVVILNNFTVEVYDSKSPESGYKRQLNSNLYGVSAESDVKDIVTIEYGSYSNKIIIITPKNEGYTTIKVTAETNDGLSSFDVLFNIEVINTGLKPEDEGRILSAELTRAELNQKIYAGDENTVYLPAGVGGYGAMTLIIDKVMAAADEPEFDYTGELKEYRWDITQNYKHYLGNMLSIDKTSGITDDGAAVIKFGTEKISAETERITLTIRLTPKIGDGYDSSKALEISFGIIVNGLGGKFSLEIDYLSERLLIVNSQIGENKGYYSFGGAPEYMYCLKPSGQSSEQWFPFMGSSMDISKLIPKSGTDPMTIAVREIDANRFPDGGYSPETRQTAALYPRRAVTAAGKKAVIYRDEKIVYSALTSGVEYILYKVGAGEFERGELTAYTGINVPKESNPLGSAVTVKFAAVTDRENPENNRFSSVEFKIKVPKAGKMPSVKDNGKNKYSGFTNAMVWSAAGVDGSWGECARGAVKYENLKYAFPGLQADSGRQFYNLYIKTAKTSKNPESGVLIIKIPADKYENY